MNNFARPISTCALFAALFSATGIWETSWGSERMRIEVFADTEVSVPAITGASITAHNLNAIARVQAEVAPVFGGSSIEEAENNARAWMETPAYEEYRRHVQIILFPLHRLSQLRIAKIPAIVINERYVIYGATDVRAALRDFEEFVENSGAAQ